MQELLKCGCTFSCNLCTFCRTLVSSFKATTTGFPDSNYTILWSFGFTVLSYFTLFLHLARAKVRKLISVSQKQPLLPRKSQQSQVKVKIRSTIASCLLIIQIYPREMFDSVAEITSMSKLIFSRDSFSSMRS